jgi:thiamine biosynthesis lipoprotein
MLPAARPEVGAMLRQIDLTCSRFRDDSELSRLNSQPGERIRVSDLFFRAIDEAIRAAEMTDGDVDPTVCSAMKAIGYDVDFACMHHETSGATIPVPAGKWWMIRLDRRTKTVLLPEGVELDLGATAKALAADLAVEGVIRRVKRGGVLVSLGGDIAMAGAPPGGGWVIRVSDDSSAPRDEDECISLTQGGVASSSTEVRAWKRGRRRLHHIVNPRTGMPADSPWRMVSVVSGSCVMANVASTAAVVRGHGILPWLAHAHLPARLVGTDDRVVRVGGWPDTGARAKGDGA